GTRSCAQLAAGWPPSATGTRTERRHRTGYSAAPSDPRGAERALAQSPRPPGSSSWEPLDARSAGWSGAGIPDRVVCTTPAGASLAQLESKDTQWAHQVTAIELGKNKKRRAIGRPPTSPSSSLTGASPTCSGFG